ncbi:hypothetical protein Sjap_012065 [Stephania japonica]|uniref:Uncharacterized protein n=1 Tax=Stephania japonica TaxID=461633 RepID=A0AAP0JCQ2_9MAGN
MDEEDKRKGVEGRVKKKRGREDGEKKKERRKREQLEGEETKEKEEEEVKLGFSGEGVGADGKDNTGPQTRSGEGVCSVARKATPSSMVEERRTYIIHMDKSWMPVPFTTHHHRYTSTLASLGGIAPTHLYTYNHVMNGFSAVLTESQLDQLEKIPGYIASHLERFGQLHTTHTTNFVGLKKFAGLWPKGGFGDDMIIGIMDTGIWPESESFKDHGMPPVPKQWRGTCEKGTDFNSSHYNRKLIGARSFSKGLKQLGIKISRVAKANYFGYAEGTSVGVAPLARFAMYKVLFLNDTYESASSDTLAGIDLTIEDGVDLMSMSLAFIETPYWENSISLGAFAALEKGIFVSCAGTVDRGFTASVTLGKGVATIEGKSVYLENLLATMGTKPAPQVAYFSSRWPARQSPWILKPDILALGVEILATWVPNRGFTPLGNDYLLTDFEIVSGTSMSSLHMVGITALLKSAHRDWSSAAIRSAMMTKADIVDNSNGRFIDMTNGTSGTPLDLRAGPVNPNNALDPGLVYDMQVEDYINFIYLKSVYRAVIQAPSGMKVVVEPMTISFGSKYNKVNFSVIVEIDLGLFVVESDYIGNYGYLSWKLIGTRSFSKGLKQVGLTIGSDDYDSPRDYFGHGSHTSSTAARSQVIDAQYFGYAKGIAMGMATRARLAMYKVVFSNDTLESATRNTLAGMNQAIVDGVDLMSLSLGFGFDPFFHNPISLGAFAAVEKGIFVACSAANNGLDAYNIMNGAPWITTVWAGTLNKEYSALLTLGKGISTIKGTSVYPVNLYISVGTIALLKSTQRDWSPAAIRSAMMTTADVTDNTNGLILDITTGKPETPLDYGAIRPGSDL